MGLTMIIVSLILLMVFAYRGYSILFIAPVFAVLAAVLIGRKHLQERGGIVPPVNAGALGSASAILK